MEFKIFFTTDVFWHWRKKRRDYNLGVRDEIATFKNFLFWLIIYDTLIMTQEALFIVNNKIVISPMNGSFIIC